MERSTAGDGRSTREVLASQDPLLSICIPTYNRAPYLSALLGTLAEAMPEGERRIEILISDNAGADDTSSVISEFRDRLPTMTYWRNDANIGAEGNMLKLVTVCRGRYLWLLGDDELLYPHTLRDLIPRLEQGGDYFVMNFSIINQTGDKCIEPSGHPYHSNRALTDADENLRLFGLRLGLISGVIVRRDQFTKVPGEDFLRYASSGHSFLYTVLMVFRNGGGGSYLSRQLFQFRSGNSDHAPTPEKWTTVYGRQMRELSADLARAGFSKSSLRSFHSMILTDYYLFCLLGHRIRGKSARAYYRSLLIDYGDVPVAWLIMTTLVVPGWAIRLGRWAWRMRQQIRVKFRGTH